MSDFVFFIKLFFLTLFLVLAMQIQMGEETLETQAISWVQTSPLVPPLNAVARGGARLIHDVSQKIHASIARNTAKGKKQQKIEKEEKPRSSPLFRWNSSVRNESPEINDDPAD